MSSAPRLSVVIPTYQRRDSVARALRALGGQTLPSSEFEVVVVMDGSDDGTSELLAGWHPTHRLVTRWQPNAGRAAARNAGIGLASGDVLLFLDDDMEPMSRCLEAHLRAHTDERRLAVVGAAPIRVDAGSPPLVARYLAPKFDDHLEKLARPGHEFRLRDFYGGNFSVRRTVLREVGPFDEAFKLYGNEDLELGLRLSRAGVTLVYCAEALACQHNQKEFAALARDTVAKGRTAVLLASKYPETLPALQLATFRLGSRRWRALRSVALAASRAWPGMAQAVVSLIGWLERREAPQLGLWYRWALDYFYWLGALAALRENRRAGLGLRSLAAQVNP